MKNRTTESKAQQVVNHLLGEAEATPGIRIVAKVGEDGPPGKTLVPVEGLSPDGWYIYNTGYGGGDSHSEGILIHSSQPLTPFDDFYGDPKAHPGVDQIQQAAVSALGLDLDSFEGLGAGGLEKVTKEQADKFVVSGWE